MFQQDYLEPVGSRQRRLAAYTLLAFAIVFAAISAAAIVATILDNAGRIPAGPANRPAPIGFGEMLLADAICVSITMVLFWLTWRLLRDRASANGITVLPTRFIQGFGVFLLAGILFGIGKAPVGGLMGWELLAACGLMCSAMIGLPWLVRRRLAADSSLDQASDVDGASTDDANEE